VTNRELRLCVCEGEGNEGVCVFVRELRVCVCVREENEGVCVLL